MNDWNRRALYPSLPTLFSSSAILISFSSNFVFKFGYPYIILFQLCFQVRLSLYPSLPTLFSSSAILISFSSNFLTSESIFSPSSVLLSFMNFFCSLISPIHFYIYFRTSYHHRELKKTIAITPLAQTLLHLEKTSGSRGYHHDMMLIWKLIRMIPSNYQWVDIVADSFRDNSIKTSERSSRLNTAKLMIKWT